MSSVKARQRQPDASPEIPAAGSGLAERVLAYFRRNSDAMDSVEGIARFWVREEKNSVEDAVAGLHAGGLLDRRLIGGTAFYSLHKDSVSAPVLPASAPAGSAARRTQRAVAAAPQNRREEPGRILVVDDDSSVRKFLVAALTDAGHSVAAAESGERGLELFRDQPCDLVLTDVRMPGMSGLALLKSIKALGTGTEVIVITAHASLDTAIEALRDGAYDLITKPLPEIESLHRVVDRALEKRRLAGDNRMLVASLQARNVELTETVARLAAVNEIGKATTGLLDTGDLYASLVRLVAQHLKARRVSVFVSGPDSDTLSLVSSIGIPEEEGMKLTLRLGEGIAGRVAATQAPLLVQDIEKTELRKKRTLGRYSTGSFMITPLTISYPIRYQRKRVGVINVSDKHSGEPFTEQDLEFLSTLASQMAAAIENARLVKEMEDGYLAALVGLIQAVEDTRPETRGHSRLVAEIAVSTARAMGLSDTSVSDLARAAALHEIGRLVSAPEEHGGSQAGAPAAAGWSAAAVMAAERVLAPITSLRMVREIILHSAKEFDPPAPIATESPAVPVESRILSIAEDYARAIAGTGRPAPAAVRRSALEGIRQNPGRNHDADVFEALRRVVLQGGAS